MIVIQRNTDENYTSIRAIAAAVWPIAYSETLSQEQLDYMMEMMYSLPSLRAQVETKQHHFIVAKEGDATVGFASYELNYSRTTKTKIHKLYVCTHHQGKGIGKQLIEYIDAQARNAQQERLVLNVNRNNNAIHFYRQIGFSFQGEEDIDIGNGYVMEDYIMEKPIK
jgi:ribosomal protein S18 acetylase RimI-like enzyme